MNGLLVNVREGRGGEPREELRKRGRWGEEEGKRERRRKEERERGREMAWLIPPLACHSNWNEEVLSLSHT